MVVPDVLRLFAFRPQAAAVDVVLRDDVAPAMLGSAGLRDIFLARNGADWGDERVIATIWDGRRLPPEDLERDLLARYGIDLGTAEPPLLELLEVRIALRHERPEPPGVLRVFRGRVRDGDFDTYLDAARSGALVDAANNAGAIALYLAVESPPDFLTVSAWTDWQAIAAATGGDIRRPFATRHAELLERMDATHYEILPGISRPDGLVESATPA